MSYGCYNRPPFREAMFVADGYEYRGDPLNEMTRTAKVKVSAFRMKMTCQYSLNDQYADPGCTGCLHNQRSNPDEPRT